MTHVVLNALLLNTGATYRGAGISGYEQHLIQALGTVNKEMTLTAIVGDRAWRAPSGVHTFRPLWNTERPSARIVWEQGWLPWVLRRLNADVYHGLAFVGPVWGPNIPHVITVHDLSFVRYPETLPVWKARYLRWFTRTSVRKAARVIAVSESTRQDLLRWLALPPEKVVTVYNGVDDRFRPLPRADVEMWRERQQLPSSFFLFVGTLQPRKNLETLVRAYARWRSLTRGSPWPLLIGGAKGWYYERLFALVRELNLEDSVRFLGYVPTADLPYLYNAASVFIYPSLFEGFGLPVLEAMACGTPVIVADTSSLPEIVGDAGVRVPPLDVDAWADALADLYNDANRRRELGEWGQRRARMFSWERTAVHTLNVYKDVGESSYA